MCVVDAVMPSLTSIVIEHMKEKRNPYVAKWNILFDDDNEGWMCVKPKLGLSVYTCYACRIIFGSKSSMLDHVNRRSIQLTYTCGCCAQRPYTFYNPCSFLLHAREHFTLTGGSIDLDDLEVKILPLGLAGFLPEPSISLMYSDDDDNLGLTNFINSRFYYPTKESRGNKTVTFKSHQSKCYNASTSHGQVIKVLLKQVSSVTPCCQFVAFQEDSVSDDSSETVKSDHSSVANSTEVTASAIVNRIEKPLYPVITKVETISETEHDSYTSVNRNHLPQCKECGIVPKTSMSDHFIHNNRPLDINLRCLICKYIAPTACSLRAHERIHLTTPPYVCPECGKGFEYWKALHDHLDNVCFHLAKQVRMRCPGKKCGKVFAQKVTYCAHFKTHISQVGFSTQEEYESHSKDSSLNEEVVKIYQCSVCEMNKVRSVVRADEVSEHMVVHADNQNHFTYVYICKHCRNYFRSTVTYATHLLRCSKLINSLTAKSSTPSNFDIHRVVINKCLKCNARFVTHGPRGTFINCPPCTSLEAQKTKETSIPQPIKVEFLDREGSNDSETTRMETQIVNCILCKESLTFNELSLHLNNKLCRYHNPVVFLDPLVSPSNLQKQMDTDSHKVESEQSDEGSPASKRKRRRMSAATFAAKHKKLSSSFNYDNNIELMVDEPIPFDGTYTCKLCSYTDLDRKQFHTHIVQHRSLVTSYQCMDCGECFIVRPSLIKHLIFYHQVTDTEQYFKENSCFDEKAIQENRMKGDIGVTVEANQCRVCMRKFANATELDTHFRTHGMAFLMRNRKY